MNTKSLFAAAIAIAAAGTAFAQTAPNLYGAEGGTQDAFVPTLSRAQVQAELAQYKRAGVNPWAQWYDPLKSFKSTANRADVTAAYVASRDEVAALNGEDSGAAYLAHAHTVPSTRLAQSTLR
jgi:hypothetical protein